MKYEIAPSILSADFWNLGKDITLAKKGGANMLHIDVMDGIFVPNISLGIPIIKAIRSKTELFLDVHLMIEEPIRYIKEFKEAGADSITVHIEACKDLDNTLKEIKKYGIMCGLAINPETSIKKIEKWIPFVDMVLLMSVHPGFGGQGYIPETTQRIMEIRKYTEENNLICNIEVDGGINFENIDEIVHVGANIIVAGSTIFKGNITEQVSGFIEHFPK